MTFHESPTNTNTGPTGLEDVIELRKELGMTELVSESATASPWYQARDKHAEKERRKSKSASAKGVIQRQRQLVGIHLQNLWRLLTFQVLRRSLQSSDDNYEAKRFTESHRGIML